MANHATTAASGAGKQSMTSPPSTDTEMADTSTLSQVLDDSKTTLSGVSGTPTPAAASPLPEAMQEGSGSPNPPRQKYTADQNDSLSDSAPRAARKESREVVAAPYGTRSRNRPGSTRINYAEDTEMDFEMAPVPGNGIVSHDMASHSPAAAEKGPLMARSGPRKAGDGSRDTSKDETAASARHVTPRNGYGSPAPAPAPPAATEKKRRKNAAKEVHAHVASAAAPSQPAWRRQNNQAACPSPVAILTFDRTGARLVKGRLEADDGQTVSIDDQVYLVCEPPGEPYYLCRVMEFLHVDNDPKQRVESLRVNWFYRPRDVQRYNIDTRLVYATMHSDLCPLSSLRGKCHIVHRSEIKDFEEFRKTKDSFWFNQVFDRFIHRYYDVIPTATVINVPDKVKKALDERWKYICLETSRVKELTSAVKTCKRCVGFCAATDSVECAVCRNTYHMNCVRPPLLKKPSRGFAWACGPCGRAQEKKLEARRTPLVSSGGDDADEEEEEEEEEVIDEEEEEVCESNPSSPTDAEEHMDLHPATQAEVALAKRWPMRYLGIHCRVEDALQYDDRAIYPRASSRLGPRHQANVNVWHGHPVELIKPAEIKKRYVKTTSHKKDAKLSKETVAAMEADKAEKAKRPKWVMDEPPGYVRRGEDYPNRDSKCTAELMFRMPPPGARSARGEEDGPTMSPEQIATYMHRAKAFARSHVGVDPHSTNFLDRCLALLTKHHHDVEAALKQVKKMDKRKDLKEPELSKEEEKKWNEGVSKYGSEIRSVRIHASKTMSYGDAVRYYYLWKKTPKGREIWGSYSNRKGKSKKVETDVKTRLVDDIADDQDDSAFDNDKAAHRKRAFQCKFCCTRQSRRWRRAPGVSPGQTVTADGKNPKDKSSTYVVALCQRCASLWRKYAVKWENTEEIARKAAQGGNKAWKRRVDEELLREVYAAATDVDAMNAVDDYSDPPAIMQTTEPPKKKTKTSATASVDSGASTPYLEPPKKEKKEKPPPPPKLPTPPPVPAQPRLRVLPCAVCRQVDGTRLECAACRMTVHKSCYGVEEPRQANKWFCDTCKNDKKESLSYTYECVLCPQRINDQDLFEPPKVSHKKKTDREREKERMEKELVEKARDEWRLKQEEKGRPALPREPLKRTADNNWVHAYCALWHAEIKFSRASRLNMVEGVGAPTLRYDAICKLCKSSQGACVSCLQCHANFHVGCAHVAGYTMGFDITPVKATRRDAVPTVTLNGETGSMVAAIWCKEHTPKTVVHPMTEPVEGAEVVALQLFARDFKQADLTLTGTARKANLVDQSTRVVPHASTSTTSHRRSSAIAVQTPTSGRGRPPNAVVKEEEPAEAVTRPERVCERCKVHASPRWWDVDEQTAPMDTARVADGPVQTNGDHGRPSTADANSRKEWQDAHMSQEKAATEASRNGIHDRTQLRVNTEYYPRRPTLYLCQKCHWKKLNAPEELVERARSTSNPVEPPVSLPSPTVQPFTPSRAPPPPATLAGQWVPPPQQAPTLPAWHNVVTPQGPTPHAQSHLHNGVAASVPISHAPAYPPYHAPYNPVSQSNGYAPYPPRPPMHAQMVPPAPLRAPFAPQPPATNGHPPPPPPLHLSNGAMVPNGLHSPHMPYSPPHTNGHASAAPPPMSYPPAPLHHVPPPLAPLTTRDVPMRDAPPLPPAAPERISTGASASPSLRNLLH